MYAKSARFYDAIYGFKDYAREAGWLHELIQEHKRSAGNSLLDVACGTGKHLEQLRQWYRCEGLELEPEMAQIARERVPDVPIHLGDMTRFDLSREFDVVTCLFSAIGYAKTVDGLQRAIGAMARHLVVGGVLIVEPWLRPEFYHANTIHTTVVDEPDLKITRMCRSERDGDLSIMEMHHLVGTPEGVTHFVERHEMMLFTDEQYLAAFDAAGLEAWIEPNGLMRDRGLVLGARLNDSRPPEHLQDDGKR